MSFFDDLGSALTGTVNNLTGTTAANLNKEALDAQTQLAKDTLANELAAQQLKYNPVLSQQRTKQIAIVVIPLAIIAGLIIYFKFIR